MNEVDLLTNHLFEYDEARLIQVFQNILGNAFKFTDEQGTIQAKFQEKDNLLFIKIFNTGKQIPDDDLNLIFDKFYQSRNQNLKKPSGSGLGLAICKKIMEAHNGSISAKNMEIGVEFEMILHHNLNYNEEPERVQDE